MDTQNDAFVKGISGFKYGSVGFFLVLETHPVGSIQAYKPLQWNIPVIFTWHKMLPTNKWEFCISIALLNFCPLNQTGRIH